MPTKNVVISAEAGLHGRPAAALAQAVSASGHAVWLRRESAAAETSVDAASMLSVMALNIGRGEEIEIGSHTPATEGLLEALAALLVAAE